MASTTWPEAIRRVLAHEGGYTDDPQDPGGPTNYGITLGDYQKYVKASGTADDVRRMPIETAKLIFKTKYWDVVEGDVLPVGIDYAVFDYGVNSGNARAIKVLQKIIGARVDGDIGDETISLLKSRDPKPIINAIQDERLAFLKGLSTWPHFKGGWSTRVADVRAYALTLAGMAQGVVPNDPGILPPRPAGTPPWLARMGDIMGLYEFSGSADNPAILAMAKACGGTIAKTYKHDSTPWCALTVNWCLLSAGHFPGTDSLMALSFRPASYGVKLDGPAVGAIGTKTRTGGGHVFFVVGKDKDGFLVARGGNQSDMVCDELIDPRDSSLQYSWPKAYPLPTAVGLDKLPVVALAPRVKKEMATLPQPQPTPNMARGTPPTPGTKASIGTAASAGAGAGASTVIASSLFGNHPYLTLVYGLCAVAIIASLFVAFLRYRKLQAEQPKEVNRVYA